MVDKPKHASTTGTSNTHVHSSGDLTSDGSMTATFPLPNRLPNLALAEHPPAPPPTTTSLYVFWSSRIDVENARDEHVNVVRPAKNSTLRVDILINSDTNNWQFTVTTYAVNICCRAMHVCWCLWPCSLRLKTAVIGRLKVHSPRSRFKCTACFNIDLDLELFYLFGMERVYIFRFAQIVL